MALHPLRAQGFVAHIVEVRAKFPKNENEAYAIILPAHTSTLIFYHGKGLF
jgi:hypothetical protein